MLLYEQISNDTLLAQRLCFYLKNGVIESEKESVLQKLHVLAASDSLRIKTIIAQSLCDSPDLPVEIVMMLCRDQMPVAAPLLQHSPQLIEEILIALINEFKVSEKLVLMARRKDITTQLANLLIKLGSAEVIFELICNKCFIASSSQISNIIKAHAHNRTLIDEVIERQNFDEMEWQCVLYNLNSHLRQGISVLIYNKLNLEVSQYCDVQQHLLSMHSIRIQQHLDVLYAKGKLDGATLFRLLKDGEVYGFVFGVAKLAEASFSYVRRELIEKWNEGCFMRIYYSAGLPAESYDVVLVLFEEIHQKKYEHKFSVKECLALIDAKLVEMQVELG